MSPASVPLYGAPRASSKSNTQDTAFSSALSALISSSTTSKTKAKTTTNPTSTERPPRRTLHSQKPDRNALPSAPNRGATKRAASDLLQLKSTPSSNTHEDEQWTSHTRAHLAKKARLYKALQRGDVDDQSEKYAVDFDRKWVDERGGESGSEYSSSSDDDAEQGGKEEVIEFTDEFGRLRNGTARDAARARRYMARESLQKSDAFTARPVRPNEVLYGDTVQSGAFDAETMEMQQLAEKRDRSATPPEASRYDAKSEVRKRGTGFMAFSSDEKERERQMRELDEERKATVKAREESGGKAGGVERGKEERKKEVDERREKIRKKREQKLADEFLKELGDEMMEKEGD